MASSYLTETMSLLRSLLAAPRRIGSIAPSSQALAHLITSEISARTGAVIELGPGTGVFTRALVARGVSQENLALIESDERLASRLRRDLGHIETLCMDAAGLDQIELFEGRQAGAVVSSLPMLGLPSATIYAILHGAFSKMHQGGTFYQYTYGPVCPIPGKVLRCLDLAAEHMGSTLSNMPPAAVYRITRAQKP